MCITTERVERKMVSTIQRSSTSVHSTCQIAAWIILTLIFKEFSTYLARSTSNAAEKTYIRASYEYDNDNTWFDNTILTWGTDYAIAVLMAFSALKCYLATSSQRGMRNERASSSLRNRSCALLLCYAVSVMAGGISHQFFTTIDSLNTTTFRILWTICVGAVTTAAGPMGMIGSEICWRLNANTDESKVRFRVPVIPDYLWYVYGGYFTILCILGEISYKRPACDIFVAGISQFVPTAYNVAVLLSIRWEDACAIESISKVSDFVSGSVKLFYRILFYVGFIGNSPLLPAYPLLVQYTELPLGVVNAMLHLNLTLSWGMQALCLHHPVRRGRPPAHEC